jgi:hypothetical protein
MEMQWGRHTVGTPDPEPWRLLVGSIPTEGETWSRDPAVATAPQVATNSHMHPPLGNTTTYLWGFLDCSEVTAG